MKRKYHFMPASFILVYFLSLLCALFFTSCASRGVQTTEAARESAAEPACEAVAEPEREPAVEAAREAIAEPERGPAAEPGQAHILQPKPARKKAISTKTQKYKEYKAVLGADPTIITPGPPGRLEVWIGIPDYKPTFPNGMTEASGTFPARGAAAKITPFAPAFKVEPKESACIQIDPTGSEIGFALTPLKEEDGTFEVGAHVQMYESTDCSGTPIPKATTTLQVKVIVEHVKKFCEVFWEQLLKFWGELLLLLSALILFLIRKQLKKLFGFGKDN